VEDVASFLATAKYLRGYRRRHLQRQLRFIWGHRRALSLEQLFISSVAFLSILTPGPVWQPAGILRPRRPRTHVSTTDRLDPVYTPTMRVGSAFAGHFRPTMVTDAMGDLNPALAEDLLAVRYEHAP
jgi:hypothetical protein